MVSPLHWILTLSNTLKTVENKGFFGSLGHDVVQKQWFSAEKIQHLLLR